MSRLRPTPIAFVTLVAAACGGGGLQYWLYPEPHLPETEEATFAVHENHYVEALDGENVNLMCWGGRRTAQAYTPRGRLCHLHILPGRHTVEFRPESGSARTASVTFTVLPGKAYGLDWSGCMTSYSGQRTTCEVKVVEIGQSEGSG